MPIILSAPKNVAIPLNVTAFSNYSFSVSGAEGIIDFQYYAGNYTTDTPPVFVPVGPARSVHLEGEEFVAFGTSPLPSPNTLMQAVHSALDALVQQVEGVTGTAV